VAVGGLLVVLLLYVAGAFVVTPPYSARGFYTAAGCSCGYREFFNVEEGELMLYFTVHNVRQGLGWVARKDDGSFEVKRRGMPLMKMRPAFWGMYSSNEGDRKEDFYPRDYLYPFALYTKWQTAREERAKDQEAALDAGFGGHDPERERAMAVNYVSKIYPAGHYRLIEVAALSSREMLYRFQAEGGDSPQEVALMVNFKTGAINRLPPERMRGS